MLIQANAGVKLLGTERTGVFLGGLVMIPTVSSKLNGTGISAGTVGTGEGSFVGVLKTLMPNAFPETGVPAVAEFTGVALVVGMGFFVVVQHPGTAKYFKRT